MNYRAEGSSTKISNSVRNMRCARNACNAHGDRSIWQVHHQLVGDWFPLSRFINCAHDFAGLVSGGHGKLAEGPEPLITAYQQVMQQHGFTTSLTSRPPLYWNGEAWVEPGELVVVVLGSSYVVARGVEAYK